MLRRIITVASIVLLCSSLSSPVSAASHVVAQASNKGPQGSVFLSRSLLPGHSYRIDVAAQGHHAFRGNGFEYLVYVQNGRLGSDNRTLQLTGTTPRSFSLQQPVSTGVNQWALTVNVQLAAGRGLTVRFVDLGRAK